MTATQIVTTGHRAPRKKMTRKKWQTVIWFVALLAITAIVIYPLLWLFASTFKPNSEFGQNQGLIPLNPTFENYGTIVEGIGGVPMWRFFANSTILAVSAVIGTLFSSSLAAYAFARIKFKGLGIFFASMIGTLLLPVHVVIIPQYIWFNKLGHRPTTRKRHSSHDRTDHHPRARPRDRRARRRCRAVPLRVCAG